MRAMSLLAPTPQSKLPDLVARGGSRAGGLWTRDAPEDWTPRKLAFADMFSPANDDTPLAILNALVGLLGGLADLWAEKSAFIEVFEPAVVVLSHLASKKCASKLGLQLKVRYAPPL